MSLVDGSSNSNKAIDNTTTPLSHTVNDALSALSDAAAAASAAVLTAASSGESSNSSEELGRQQNEDSVEQEKETGAEQGRVDGGRTASSRSPSNVTAQSTRMPDTVASAADALAVAPEASASMKSKQEDVNDSSTARGSHMDSIHSTHACHSVYPDSASAAAAADSGNTSSNSMTNVNNGSSASDVVKLSSGRRDSLNSESTSGSLKRE